VSSLDGQVALITGCGRYRGLGRGIALALARSGADVAVTDLDGRGVRNLHETDDPAEADWRGLPSLVAEIEALGRRATGLLGDVGRSDDAQRMVDEAVERLGAVDILVNNAGAPQGTDRGWTWEVPEDAFDLVMRVNAKGAFLMSSAVARHLLGRRAPGRIVNIASGAGKRGLPQRAAYCASKFAVIGLTQTMALELAPHGVTVNAVCPGAIDTARQRSRTSRSERGGPGAESAAAPASPIARLGQPEDVARAVCFLVEPTGDFVTGQAINVDGGLIMD
jgi:NAD(P)-dependent dehydrogenase (short-subunit alcohol dehydrogenase family)